MSVKSKVDWRDTRHGTEYSAGIGYPTVNNLVYDSRTLIDDGGHYGFPDFPPNQNVGGYFSVQGERYEHGDTANVTAWRGGANQQKYVGRFRAQVTKFSGNIAALDGSAWASDAYKRMKPTKPLFSALNSIFELKDLPGMLRQRISKDGLKDVSNYFLAYQFGWKPLLSDIVKLFYIQQDMEKRLKWLLSHNGKPVRRRVNIAETISDPGLLAGNSYAGLYPVLVTQYYTRQPTYLEKTWTEDRVWASARFRYWLPEGPRDVQWTNKMKRALLGLNPSPSVVYNAVPWTWLIDWFTNVGNLIENVEPGVADRLAADYFYVMREIQWRRTQDTVGFFRDPQGNPFTVSASASYSKFRKTRIKGDPFGFNTNPASLSGVQLAILGALGMSRIR